MFNYWLKSNNIDMSNPNFLFQQGTSTCGEQILHTVFLQRSQLKLCCEEMPEAIDRKLSLTDFRDYLCICPELAGTERKNLRRPNQRSTDKASFL